MRDMRANRASRLSEALQTWRQTRPLSQNSSPCMSRLCTAHSKYRMHNYVSRREGRLWGLGYEHGAHSHSPHATGPEFQTESMRSRQT